MTTRKSEGLRTIEVARRAGYSVQQVRNLERDGVLPPAARTGSGYRSYDERHVWSALAYRSLAAATGPVEAKAIMRAAQAYAASQALRGGRRCSGAEATRQEGQGCSDSEANPQGGQVPPGAEATLPVDSGPGLFALLDAAHARLDAERRALAMAKQAAEAIAAEPIADMRPSDSLSISELAEAIGVRPSTLRHWDAEGLVVPSRASAREARRYSPADVRTARIVHQLRLAGYGIAALRVLVPQLGGGGEVGAALAAREAAIERRGRGLLEAAGALGRLVL
ncbi:MerR family transcriptional regulator [Amycolatopsis sacchari]|uniref:DNA-binding transcriptional regulator, MerR family n=1 Tax=Amycolatopsis sacchari TaxID=115433 RepID=A0A1I3LU94_9PSEU|nr:MerR family transcriptional regulator [Amycolatopsis sacchari]SFI88233.1 DNA-binding transcriptional regulator, MerR family [Amycolatopsis sacchari]